jgi:hypothetical protein
MRTLADASVAEQILQGFDTPKASREANPFLSVEKG